LIPDFEDCLSDVDGDFQNLAKTSEEKWSKMFEKIETFEKDVNQTQTGLQGDIEIVLNQLKFMEKDILKTHELNVVEFNVNKKKISEEIANLKSELNEEIDTLRVESVDNLKQQFAKINNMIEKSKMEANKLNFRFLKNSSICLLC